ncbi:bacteriorhodopsin [Truncatella angustata]|uniref:Bacteriorhodopsin n=1 Tax=Truncatella angustata TaxID=152316 RepID=A0A9P8RQ41_9PEZI|nr:bacteriorhodopsin [Truncatella angustata]KAH6647305.1 bacteriorhodopsin [Truncatella angustata]
MSGNQALNINDVVGQQPDLSITTRASDWYFAVCAVMGFSTLVFMGLGLRKAYTDRVFHYITAAITATACIAYFSMGSNLGQVPIQAEFLRPGSSQVGAAGTREIFYVRYIDWAITTPLLLLDLLLTAGLPTSTILITIFADEVMIVTGLVGALTRTSYKWGYWTFGMFALFYIAYNLIIVGRSHANAIGGAPKKTYLMLGVALTFLWFLYPIAWGISEGGNVIHPDSEAIFYGILDVLAKPVWGALLIWGHRNITPEQLGMHIRDSKQAREKHPEGPGGSIPDRANLAAHGTQHNGAGATAATNV